MGRKGKKKDGNETEWNGRGEKGKGDKGANGTKLTEKMREWKGKRWKQCVKGVEGRRNGGKGVE